MSVFAVLLIIAIVASGVMALYGLVVVVRAASTGRA